MIPAVTLAIVVGALFTAAVYMMLRRSVVKLVIGLAQLGHAANLLVFSAPGPLHAAPPIVGADGLAPAVAADPLPQALVLTAIVISFGVLAYAVTLIHRVHEETGRDDLDDLDRSDP